ncbi:hypothetical protein FLM9_1008 [Candidatus Synechococcus spongiarum]|uniref:Uncharacterized protein n=1 Tax=Candidatus Synechococcus spongiarum TaxID=431041 RepID=A0A170TC12_9SYNE|nr:hypothetical protein FLM9_1008 [Candidatus Synechococcus spongiarum]
MTSNSGTESWTGRWKPSCSPDGSPWAKTSFPMARWRSVEKVALKHAIPLKKANPLTPPPLGCLWSRSG